MPIEKGCYIFMYLNRCKNLKQGLLKDFLVSNTQTESAHFIKKDNFRQIPLVGMSLNYLPKIGAPVAILVIPRITIQTLVCIYYFCFNVSCFYRISLERIKNGLTTKLVVGPIVHTSQTKTKSNPRSKNANPDLGTQCYSCQNSSRIGGQNQMSHNKKT